MVKSLLGLAAPHRGMVALVLILLVVAAGLEGVGLSLFMPLLGTLTSHDQGVGMLGLGMLGVDLNLLEGFSFAQRMRIIVVALIAVVVLKNVVGYAARCVTRNDGWHEHNRA